MDHGPVLDELKGLSSVDEMLIARVLTYVCLFVIKNITYGYSGGIINCLQDLST